MPVDYAALARQHGGSVVEDEDTNDYSDLASMRPMVAHTPRSQAVDYAKLAGQHGGVAVDDVGTLDEEYRTPPIGVDPRLEPDTVMNPAQTRETAGDIAGGYADYGMMAAAGPAGNAAARVLAKPATSAAIAGGLRLIKTGDPVEAAMAAGGAYGLHKAGAKVLRIAGRVISKSLAARLQHQVTRAAATAETVAATETAPTVAKVASEVAEAVPDAEGLVRTMQDVSAPTKARMAARAVLEKAFPGKLEEALNRARVPQAVAEEVAPAAAEIAAPQARQLAPIPAKGNVRPATVYTATPVQGPKPLTEMQIVTRARQLEAAKAAGVDLGEAFGGAVRLGAQAEQAAESALETRLRASVLMKKNPMGLANEIAGRISEMSSAKPEKITDAIEALYGLPRSNIKQMVEMVLREAAR